MLAATDFFTVEVWTANGLVRYHVLFVITLATREVRIAGIVPEPWESWIVQVARNLTDPWKGFFRSCRWLIHDRSTMFAEQFRQFLRSERVEALRLPARSPNLNAYAERFVRSIRQECLEPDGRFWRGIVKPGREGVRLALQSGKEPSRNGS